MARPTLAEILTRVQTAIKSRLENSNPGKRRGFLPAIAYALAGASNELHGRMDQEKKSMHPLWSRDEALRAWCALMGVPQDAGTQATGTVIATGADGGVIATGEQLLLGAVYYEAVADAVIASGTANVSVRALDVGVAGNAAAGVTLKFIRTIAGVNNSTTVDENGLTGGTDAAGNDALHDALQFHFQHPPGCGNDDDYKRWAREASPLVTNVWIGRREQSAASVTVRVMTYGATETGIPTTGVLDAVRAYITARMPATAELFVVAPVADVTNIVLERLTPNTDAVKDAVMAEYIDLLQREAEPGGTMLWSHLADTMAYAGVVTDYKITSPVDTQTFATGHIPVAGTITVTG